MLKMKLIIVCAILTSLTGCAGATRLNNDMIINEAIKCDQAGLPWRQTFNYDGTVKEVICTPRQVYTGRIADPLDRERRY